MILLFSFRHRDPTKNDENNEDVENENGGKEQELKK